MTDLNGEPELKRQKLDEDSKKDEGLKNDVREIKSESALQSETDVGIVEYISSHKGFSGVIKQRYSDFLVNEITENGEIVHLTDISKPSCDIEVQHGEVPTEMPSVLEEFAEQLDELKNDKSGDKDVKIEVGDDKEQRGKIHKAIKMNYPSLDSTTVDIDGTKYIKVLKANSKGRAPKRQNAWPSTRGSYCRFVLYKENKDTMDAVNEICKYLRCKPGSITYGGTKDKRAKTCQQLSIQKVEASRLQNLFSGEKYSSIVLGNFRYVKEPLKLGDHNGNHFTIVLRNVTGSEEQISEGMKSLENVGFINYYGMQRFGTTSVPTHAIGKKLLQEKWSEAIDLILKPRESVYCHENNDVARARKIWTETHNAREALAAIGRRSSIERHILVGLEKCGEKDLVSALSSIPRNTRLMYIHSYQSLVWNRIVSKRIKDYGLKLMTGDLVLKEDKKGPDVKPIIITEENLKDFKIQDMVLPLPGYDVLYPENEVKTWYENMFVEDGLDGNFKSKVRDYSLPGGYRKVICKPDNVSWKLKTYDDVTMPLVQSDYEKIKGNGLPKDVTDGKYKALILEFSLPSSAYATMAIREVLKVDTSSAHQSTLNVT